MSQSQQGPTAEEIRDKVSDQVRDFDEDQWEERMEKTREQFGKYAEGDDAFVARAVAHRDYAVKIDAPGSLPGGSGGSSDGLQDNIDTYKIADLKEVDHEGDEQVTIEGFVMDRWWDTSSNNNRQLKVRLRDDTGSTTVMATGDTNVENLSEAGIQKGDFIRLEGAEVFHPEDSDYYGVTTAYWVEVKFPSGDDALELTDIAKDYQEDIINEGDLVVLGGLVHDEQVNEYEGCTECMTKYDPEEDEGPRVCPSCGHNERKTYRPGRISVRTGDGSIQCSFPPSNPVPKDVMFGEVSVTGTHETEEYEGTEYEQVEVNFCEVMEEGVDLGDDLGDDDEDIPSDMGDDVEETTEDGSPEDESSDDGGSSEFSEPANAVRDKVKDFDDRMPATAGRRILKTEFNVTDEEDQAEYLVELRDMDDIEVHEEGDSSLEDPESWREIMLEPK